jgi:2-hydroxychromene-2-carboxylate isomerase
MNKKTPVYYFSFRSPYSWIATRLLAERLTLDELARIEFVPYWEPDPPTLASLRERGGDHLYQPMSRAKHLYILQDVRRITRGLGLRHVWPVERNPSWEQPVLAYLAAEEDGRSAPFRAALYRARWEQGCDIHAPDVLARLAAECGIDPERVRAASTSPSARERALTLLLRAYQDDVFGVPFFLLGHDKFWGVDRLEAFIAALRGQPYRFGAGWPAPSAEPPPLPPDLVRQSGVLDTDTAGGCG